MKNQVKQGKQEFQVDYKAFMEDMFFGTQGYQKEQALALSAPMMYEALKALWEAREDGRAMYRSAQVDKLVLDALAQAEGGR